VAFLNERRQFSGNEVEIEISGICNYGDYSGISDPDISRRTVG
jgi:hypothetical protein